MPKLNFESILTLLTKYCINIYWRRNLAYCTTPEDLIQTAFVCLLKNCPQLKNCDIQDAKQLTSEIETAIRVAVNRGFEQVRSKARSAKRRNLPSVSFDSETIESTPGTYQDNLDLENDIDSLLHAFSESERSMIKKKIAGYTISEIAQLSEVSTGEARIVLAKFKHRLRSLLDG